MLCSYNEYLGLNKTISFEECKKLHQDMLEEIGRDEDAIEMYDYMIEKATEYVVLRSNWTTRDREWKMNEDPRRTATHDVLINHFNMLARYLKSIGKTADWRDALGYVEDDPANRTTIGDFACFIVFIHALNGR